MKKANNVSTENKAKQIRPISKMLQEVAGKLVPCKLVQNFLFLYFLEDKQQQRKISKNMQDIELVNWHQSDFPGNDWGLHFKIKKHLPRIYQSCSNQMVSRTGFFVSLVAFFTDRMIAKICSCKQWKLHLIWQPKPGVTTRSKCLLQSAMATCLLQTKIHCLT